jgi:two-component system cell cycle response regulator
MKARILIIDDNPTNLKLATDVLLSDGFVVETAQDAEQAQAILEQRIPELILMDVALPGMDGLTLTRRLKADKRFAHLPIVALTASAMRGDQEKALTAGCAGYISKPINTRTLGLQVRALLHLGKGGADQSG